MIEVALSDAEKPRILVVDDSIVDRNLYVHMVKKWGYLVAVASDGLQAIEIIKQQRIQLVLVDWQMPGMLGTDLCEQLRGLSLSHYTYIILMSAQHAEEFLITALDSGADDVLSKPIDANELEARLHSAVRRIELQTRLAIQNANLSHAHDLIAQDLRTVSKVQRSYLPEKVSEYEGLDYRWLSVPSQYVSGDHLNVFPLNDDLYGFYVLDVSGHGIPAAVKSMQLVQTLSDFSATSVLFDAPYASVGTRGAARPRDVVARLNKAFQQTETDLSYFTMIYGIFDVKTQRVTLCQAGHPSPLVLHSDGGVSVLGNGGYPVGLFDMDEFEDITLELDVQDALMLYSDGVTEVLSPSGEPYGEDRLLSFLNAQTPKEHWTDLPTRLELEVKSWGGQQIQEQGFEDDLSILMLSSSHAFLEKSTGLSSILEHEQVFRPSELAVDLHNVAAPIVSESSIVIVDDSRSFLSIFEAMLNSWGYKVFPAKSGQEAVELIERVQPDFVLTDWDMPGMSGIELCEQVRGKKDGSYVYIIMITGYASRDDLLHSLKVGADDFLTKPVNPSELNVRLKTAHRIADLHKSMERKHQELSALYLSLERDMREVSRIQRSLLPKARLNIWPVSLDTLYKPRRFVSSKQIGVMPAHSHEFGFFVLALSGEGTSTALQAMALARWFSSMRATQVLFPPDDGSQKPRRHLAVPAVVKNQLTELTALVGVDDAGVDLLYGLLNLNQGTLLVAGMGEWTLVLMAPGRAVKLFQVSAGGEASQRDLSVLYQDVIVPGCRVFAMPSKTAQLLDLSQAYDWQDKISSPQREGCVLGSDFANLNAQASSFLDDPALIGFQWREFFEVKHLESSQAERSDWIAEAEKIAAIELDPSIELNTPIALGRFMAEMSYCAVVDTANVSILSTALREFAESLGFGDELVYNTDLVVTEMLTNVMSHGFKYTYPKPVTLIFLAFENAVVILLRDQGARIPEHVLKAINPDMSYLEDVPLEEMPEGGMGLTFMRMASARFSYNAAYAVEKPYNQLGLLLLGKSFSND